MGEMSEAAKVFADDILMPIGRAVACRTLRTNGELTGFFAMKGERYRPSGLMVIGRAVNGWVDGICAAKLTDSAVRNEFALKVQERSATPPDGCSCPMSWVTTQWGATDCYNTKRSAFWRVIRRVVDGLGIAKANDRDWSSHLVWSNLYKLSPEAGGNPSSGIMGAQLEGCKKLNALELKTYRPSRLLMLTGEDWAEPFLDALRSEGRTRGQHVQRTGRWNLLSEGETHVVVAVHPQCKNERDWGDEVLKGFRELKGD